MTQILTPRQRKHLEAVAEKARNKGPVLPRGRPTPENLTEQGRQKGLKAMHNAPRCRAKRRDGEPCQKPAMRGATRCATHGGRSEVPDHPAVIKRFLSGNMHKAIERHKAYMDGKKAWESMTLGEQRELVECLPKEVVKSNSRLYEAAILWKLQDQMPQAVWRRKWLATTAPKKKRPGFVP